MESLAGNLNRRKISRKKISQKVKFSLSYFGNHVIFEHNEIFPSHCAEQRCGVKAAISSRTQYINH